MPQIGCKSWESRDIFVQCLAPGLHLLADVREATYRRNFHSAAMVSGSRWTFQHSHPNDLENQVPVDSECSSLASLASSTITTPTAVLNNGHFAQLPSNHHFPGPGRFSMTTIFQQSNEFPVVHGSFSICTDRRTTLKQHMHRSR